MVKFRRTKGGKAEARQDGQIRTSQIVTTFGPGAMVDLLDQAVLVGGLDFWNFSKYVPMNVIHEGRLRDHLVEKYRLNLAPDDAFRAPPPGDDKEPTKFQGIPVLEFPHWFVCQGCRALVRASDELAVKGTKREHNCDGGRTAQCVPVRFVGACKNGHIQDWPWRYFVHAEGACPSTSLELREGETGDFSQIRVVCRGCGAKRPLSEAQTEEIMPTCEGQRPWLGQHAKEDCDEKLRLLVRTASNGYFPQVLSALSIPDPGMELKEILQQNWRLIENASAKSLPIYREEQEPVRRALEGYSDDDVLAMRDRLKGGEKVRPSPLRTAEYAQFMAAPVEEPRDGDKTLIVQRWAKRDGLPKGVGAVVLAHKLREVRTEIGFTRLEPVTMDAHGEYDLEVKPAPLALNRSWLPASEIWGEGVFIELDEAAVRAWEGRASVKARADELLEGFRAWKPQKKEDEDRAFLGVRFYMLHSLSHLLISAMSLECGYAASAIRERIYCGPCGDDKTPMAGILLSTGSAGSEGTLGGLVDQGRRLGAHIQSAINMGKLCSNDPVCAGHSPKDDPAERYLEGAACHGCLFIAECSCERFNRYLDRALVVPTMGRDSGLAFFA